MHIIIVALNYLHSGFRHVPLTELGRKPNSIHRAIYGRVASMITASDAPGEFPLPPGRAGPEFIARLFDLECFAGAKGFSKSDPYMDFADGEHERVGRISEAERFKPDAEFSPFDPYRSLNANRLKLSGTGTWPLDDFLEDELWLPYLEPSILALPDRRSVGPTFQHEDFDQNLQLARIWDARGLLAIFDEKPRFFARVFNAHKSAELDRQIGDRRHCNQHEMHPRGPSSMLPNGVSICSIHCPKGYVLHGCISDRKDFYHQCKASRARAWTNCLPFRFDAESFRGSPALECLDEILSRPTSRSVHGDRYGLEKRVRKKVDQLDGIYCGFKSLFQGDHLGVEYALSGHQTTPTQVLRHSTFPAGPVWEGLVIDDYFVVSCDRDDGSTPASLAYLEKAEKAYMRHKVVGSDEKTIRADSRFKIIGAEVAADRKNRSSGGVYVGAPSGRRCALTALSLRVCRLPVISRDIASRLAGGWVSTLMFRRPLTCILHKIFDLGSRTSSDGREVLSLSRSIADEIVVACALSFTAITDVSVPYTKRIYATDASLARGAVVSKEIPISLAKTLWLGGDRKGAYTKLENSFREIIKTHEDGIEDYVDEEQKVEKDHFGSGSVPAAIDFVFDLVEICGGSGIISQHAAKLGLRVCTPLDISSSEHFDLCNIDMLWWILGMIRSGRFRAVCLEPPCTTFSPAQHPASRSYAQPLGFKRDDPKTLLGNILAFRCILISWCCMRWQRPSLLEQARLSKMAWLAMWRYLLEIGFEEACLASCRFGSIHRKEFRFLGQGLDMASMNLPCLGGHHHVRIEGKYTRASAVYVPKLAAFIAELFYKALKRQDADASLEKGLPQIESVILNDVLSSDGWSVDHTWAWRYPSHINIFESYSIVSLQKKLIQEGGDCRYNALSDSRVAKGAHAKGRSSSSALRGSLQKACAYTIAGNLHPSYGFAPTRLNTADAPTRMRELPTASSASILDFLSDTQIADIHSKQFSRPTAGWIRLFVLVSCLTLPVDGLPLDFSQISLPLGFGLPAFLLSLAHSILSCITLSVIAVVLWTSARQKHRFGFLWILPVILSLSELNGRNPKINNLGLAPPTFLAEAMPISANGAEETRRAQRRSGVQLHVDRVVREKTRSNRQFLLNQFAEWVAENTRITLNDLLFSNEYDAEFIAEVLTAYGKEMFYSGKAYGRFAETINSVTSARPALRKQLAAAWDLAFNWIADEPRDHHPALPVSILLAISGLALLWGWVREASIFLLSWAGLLRVGEVFAATRREVILPRDAAPGTTSMYLKIMQPKTRGRAARHQCARVDFPDIIELFDAWFGDKNKDERLWDKSPQTLRKRFSQLQDALGLVTHRQRGKFPYDLGSFRPGGATFMLQQTEDSEMIRRRGRWLSTRVLEIYLQETVVSTYHHELTASSREKIAILAGRFSEIHGKAISFLRTGVPPAAWPLLW